jgi:D-alanyl-D-alanine carboxypeptidase
MAINPSQGGTSQGGTSQGGGPSTSARSAFVMDVETGRVLYAKNPYQAISDASVNKLMTSLIAYEAIAQGKLKLTPSVKQTLVDMLHPSNNQAADSMAAMVGGSTRGGIDLMNKRAKEIGMRSTNFVTASGLRSGAGAGDQKTTAYDRAIMMAHLYKNHKDMLLTFSSGKNVAGTSARNATFSHIKNHPDFLAGKTGTGNGVDGSGGYKKNFLGLFKIDRKILASGVFELPTGTSAQGNIAHQIARDAVRSPMRENLAWNASGRILGENPDRQQPNAPPVQTVADARVPEREQPVREPQFAEPPPRFEWRINARNPAAPDIERPERFQSPLPLRERPFQADA